jgi:iron complex transport system substrate-binding protein
VPLLAAVILLVACGTTDEAGTPTSATMTLSDTAERSTAPGTRAVVDDRGVEVVIGSTERIIPLDGDVAEIVFALGLGDRVVATDLSATFPPEADAVPQIGYQRALNAEPILAFEPTLVIGTDIAGPSEAIDDLERVGVPVVIVPTPSDATGPGVKIRAVAEALGIPDDGERLAATVESEIAEATPGDPAASAAAGTRIAMLYLRGSSTQLLFGDGTSIDWLIEAAGAVNVADEMGIVDSADITAEALIAAAPDVLLVTEDGLASVGGIDGLVALPSLAATPAAINRAVLAYDAQLMLGNGPRTGTFLATLLDDLTALRARLATQNDPDIDPDIDKETP